MSIVTQSRSKNRFRPDLKEVRSEREKMPVRRSPNRRKQERILKFKERVSWYLMLPFCLLSLLAFMELFMKASLRGSLLTSSECVWFALGALFWGVLFATMRRSFVVAYVFAHEMTHIVTALLFGAVIYDWHVGKDGGWVDTNKSNTFISLSPYVVPFYTLLVLLVFGITGLFVDVNQVHFLHVSGYDLPVHASKIMHCLVGFTWCFHLTFTLTVMREEQGDLVRNGQFFSVWLIALLNLYLIICFLISFSHDVTWADVYGCLNDRLCAILGGVWDGVTWAWGKACAEKTHMAGLYQAWHGQH